MISNIKSDWTGPVMGQFWFTNHKTIEGGSDVGLDRSYSWGGFGFNQSAFIASHLLKLQQDIEFASLQTRRKKNPMKD